MQHVTRDDCLRKDQTDALAPLRDRFELAPGLIYLDGNSLGPLPKATPSRVDEAMQRQWGQDLIKSWNSHGWITLPQRVGDKIGQLIGAASGQVVAADSTSINLFKLLAAALAMRPGRGIILSEPGNFPTDLYMVQGLSQLLGDQRCQLRLAEEDDIVSAIDASVAAVMLTHVNFKSGRIHDMASLTRAAQQQGALVIWDLAHSAGAVPVELDRCAVDFAVGCGYKYLNGGPGAPAFLYVAERHQNQLLQPLTGWIGHAAPFAFDPDYRPAPGITRNLCGTPGILGMVALEAGIDIWLEADLAAVREKSMALGDLFIQLMAQQCGGFGFTLASPTPAQQRGSQVAYAHPDGYAIMQALIARDVIGDFRAPDLLRFGFTPLYTRYVDVWDAVARLGIIMESREYDQERFRVRAAVT